LLLAFRNFFLEFLFTPDHSNHRYLRNRQRQVQLKSKTAQPKNKLRGVFKDIFKNCTANLKKIKTLNLDFKMLFFCLKNL